MNRVVPLGAPYRYRYLGEGDTPSNRGIPAVDFPVNLAIISKKRPASRNTPKKGATRRELFYIGNSLMLPALLGGSQAMAATGPLRPRQRHLPVDRRRAGDQLPRHIHDHRRIGRTARSAGRHAVAREVTGVQWNGFAFFALIGSPGATS
jgi:hypothetical protein